MKRKILSLCICTALFITGCSTLPQTSTIKTDSPSAKTEATEAPAPTDTPAPEDTTLALGEKGSFGDWEITVKKASVKKKIDGDNYRQYKPGDGKSFIVVSLSVSNNGKKEETFLPRMGLEDTLVTATLLYEDEYEYSPTQLLSYDKDLTTRKIQPLSKESGVVAFEVPKKVADAKKQVKLKIGTKSDYIVYSLG